MRPVFADGLCDGGVELRAAGPGVTPRDPPDGLEPDVALRQLRRRIAKELLQQVHQRRDTSAFGRCQFSWENA